MGGGVGGGGNFSLPIVFTVSAAERKTVSSTVVGTISFPKTVTKTRYADHSCSVVPRTLLHGKNVRRVRVQAGHMTSNTEAK